MMKTRAVLFAAIALCMLMASCGRGYDPAECARLADKVAIARPLSQDDYASMIEQSRHILSELIETADSATAGLTAHEKEKARAALRDDAAFMERFDYMFTFSSVLYRAHLSGSLDPDNTVAYEALDSCSDRFASLCASL